MIGSTRLTSGSVPPQLLEFARWRQIRYCFLRLGADGHSAGALQIRGSVGRGEAVGSRPPIFQCLRRLQVGKRHAP